jgi:uncharacterized protein YbjT (DUF2867 family)
MLVDAIVIGARGALGKHVCAELAARGHRVTAARRDAAIVVADLIVNCAGASMAPGLGHGWRGYGAVDVSVGLAAIEAAKRCGARLVYVGVHHPPGMRRCAYIAAHERVAEAMREVDGCVVRATGFFSAFASFLPMARRGWLVDVGDGRRRTNPIDERDLAAIVVEAALGKAKEVAAGGPEVMTRADILETVAAAVAPTRVRTVRAPVWLARAGSFALRLVHPRMGQLGEFATHLARHDVVAPALGTSRLAEYFADHSGSRRIGYAS